MRCRTRMSRLIELDYKSLPTEIQFAGDVQELVIRGWIMQEIDFISPTAGEAMDLSVNFFRWSEVSGAAYYRVNFGYLGANENGIPTAFGLGLVETKSARLSLGASQDESIELLKKRLLTGRTGIWNVNAYDSDGRKIGTNLELNRPFLVASGLGEK